MFAEKLTADAVMYGAFSTPRDAVAASNPGLSIYQLDGHYNVHEDLEAFIDTPEVRRHYGSGVKISYTTMGYITTDETPQFLVLHGVPTNKKQWYPVAKYLALFGFVVCVDMLGMGMSDKPRLSNIEEDWKWKHDLKYLRPFAKKVFRRKRVDGSPRRFIFVSDDWGSGIHAHYAAKYPDDIAKNIFLDPVAGDGYPVKEIEAIGRAAKLPDVPPKVSTGELTRFADDLRGMTLSSESDRIFAIKIVIDEMIALHRKISEPPQLYFQHAMAAFDQTVIQIIKTMTYDPNVTNQYNQRDFLEPYADIDYEERGARPGTMPLKFGAIRVLAERASALSADQLLPFHPWKNLDGVRYSEITADTLVMWGEFDNMMPAAQVFRFQAEFTSARCDTLKIPRAGHFAGLDQPELVAEGIMSFLNRDPRMREGFNDVYQGFTGIRKGDNKHVARTLRGFYKIADFDRDHAMFHSEAVAGIEGSISSPLSLKEEKKKKTGEERFERTFQRVPLRSGSGTAVFHT